METFRLGDRLLVSLLEMIVDAGHHVCAFGGRDQAGAAETEAARKLEAAATVEDPEDAVCVLDQATDILDRTLALQQRDVAVIAIKRLDRKSTRLNSSH